MKYFSLANKHDAHRLEFKNNDQDKNRIFVLKSGSDTENSRANTLYNFIKLNAELKTPAAILVAFHELGHLKDPNFSVLDMFSLGKSDDQGETAKKVMARERFAWAYSLSQLKPFLAGMKVSPADLKILVHEYSLGTYSDFIKMAESL